jgi:hypothetical protein
MGPRAGLDGCGKSNPHRDSSPRTAQSVASRYTDCTMQAHKLIKSININMLRISSQMNRLHYVKYNRKINKQ